MAVPRKAFEESAAPGGRKRHLEAVARSVDAKAAAMADGRRHFTPIYDDVLAIETLSGGPKLLYSLLVRLQGDEEDGRRAIAGKEQPFIAATQAFLAKRLGATRDEIQSWTDKLEQPHPCSWCGFAHALLRTSKPYPTARIAYTFLKCRDVPTSQRVPLEALPKGAAVRHDARGKNGRFSSETVAAEQMTLTASIADSAVDPERLSGKSPQTPAPARRVLMLQIMAEEMHGVSVPVEILELIAGQEVFDAAGLEQLLIRVLSVASLNRQPLSLEIAQRVLAECVAGEPDEAGVSGGAEFAEKVRKLPAVQDRLLLLARRREPGTPAIAMQRLYETEIFPACLRARDGEPLAAERLAQDVVTDPRVDRAPNPIATLRMGVREGWLFTPAESDNGSAAVARAYAKLPPGARSEVERMVREHVQSGSALDYDALRKYGVFSKAMIAHVKVVVSR